MTYQQVVLVVSALLVNAVALWAIAARITEFGFSPNRVAALGENVILLVNLAWSAVLYIRFLRGRASFSSLERWQTDYLPVYAVWAATVVIVFSAGVRVQLSGCRGTRSPQRHSRTKGSYGIPHSELIHDLHQRRAGTEGRDAHDSGGTLKEKAFASKRFW